MKTARRRTFVRFFPLCCMAVLALLACSPVLAYPLKVVNVSDIRLRDYPVEVPLEKLPARLRTDALRVTAPGGEATLSQVDDLDGDGRPDELVFPAEVGPGAAVTYRVQRGGVPAGWRRPGGGPRLRVPERLPALRGPGRRGPGHTGL